MSSKRKRTAQTSASQAPVEYTREYLNGLLDKRWRQGYKSKKREARIKFETKFINDLKDCIKWFQNHLQEVIEEPLKTTLQELLDEDADDNMENVDWVKMYILNLKNCIRELDEQVSPAVYQHHYQPDQEQEPDQLRQENYRLTQELKMEKEAHQATKQELEKITKDQHMINALKEACGQLPRLAKEYGLPVKATASEDITEQLPRILAKLDATIIKTVELENTCEAQKSELVKIAQKADRSSEEHNQIVSDLQNQLRVAETKRRELHNIIMELKGNIRIFCRVRPLLPNDGPAAETTVSFPHLVESAGEGIDLYQSGQKHTFTFDKVFDHKATQQDVFMEISLLVQSALDGYKVCIFAYGQTGSGKTYTMMGLPEIPMQKGLIPRSLEQIFETSQALAAQGWKYKMQASMLEIYNESIRDLLSSRSSNEGADAGKQYAIRHDADGNTYVSDLTICDVCSVSQVSDLLKQAAHSRSVGKTDMNEHSSRSHLVFTLRIYGVNESTEQRVQGVLNLIDLAGSERLSRSGATGERLKETQAINKSLSSLSDVIFALAKKDNHVPFRNSKLTHLLQPCLGGDSKTLLFVNVSPDPSSFGESLTSLRFAERVSSCEIGVPRRQTIKPLDSR